MNKFIYILLIAFVIVSCSDKYEEVNTYSVNANTGRKNESSLMFDSLSGFSFLRLSAPTTKGLELKCAIPKELRGERFKLIFEGQVRTNYAHSNGVIAMELSNEKKERQWFTIGGRYYFLDVNKWSDFRDSIYLKSKFNEQLVDTIYVFSFLSNSDKEKFDIRSLNVRLEHKVR